MRVHGKLQFLDGGLEQSADDQGADQLTGVRPDDVRTQQLPIVRIPDELDEPIGLADRARATVRAPREASDGDLEALRARPPR